jgi:hypothetical protein
VSPSFSSTSKDLRIRRVGRGAEQGQEGFLNFGDVGADAELRAGAAAQVVGAGKMVGMGVGVEDPVDPQVLRRRRLDHGVRRGRAETAGIRVEIQHRINDRGGPGGRVPDKIGHRIGGGVEEGLEVRHGAAPFNVVTVIYEHLLN